MFLVEGSHQLPTTADNAVATAIVRHLEQSEDYTSSKPQNQHRRPAESGFFCACGWFPGFEMGQSRSLFYALNWETKAGRCGFMTCQRGRLNGLSGCLVIPLWAALCLDWQAAYAQGEGERRQSGTKEGDCPFSIISAFFETFRVSRKTRGFEIVGKGFRERGGGFKGFYAHNLEHGTRAHSQVVGARVRAIIDYWFYRG